MSRILVSLSIAAGLAIASLPARAGGIDVRIGLGYPGVVYYEPAPRYYYAPRPVYRVYDRRPSYRHHHYHYRDRHHYRDRRYHYRRDWHRDRGHGRYWRGDRRHWRDRDHRRRWRDD